jgi:hypothetical protein
MPKIVRMVLIGVILALISLYALVLRGPAQRMTADPEWLKSGNPCWKTEQQKKQMKAVGGVEINYIKCYPVLIRMTWDFEERYRYHSGLGEDRLLVTLWESFGGYIQVTYDPQKKGKVTHFFIFGPAPCCPGKVQFLASRLEASILGHAPKGFSGTAFKAFEVEPGKITPSKKDPGVFSMTWTRDGLGNAVGMHGPYWEIEGRLVPEPFSWGAGGESILQAKNYKVSDEAASWDEIRPFFEKQEVWQKEFPLEYVLDLSMIDESYALRGKVKAEIDFAEPGKLQVTPGDGLASSGPDDNDRFVPSSKAYILKNTGKSPIHYSVSKTQNWLQLSGTEGTLNLGRTAEVNVSVNEQTAKSLKPGDYKDTVTFTNTTNGSGDTTRLVTLSVGQEEQTWRVLLSGQETDDIGGKLMHMRLQDKWRNQVVEYGVRFDYKLTVEFTIRKKEGTWVYKNGTITAANVKATHVFDPTVFKVKDEKAVCKNCQEVDALAGTSLSGGLSGNTVHFFWPRVIANAVVYNRLKLETTSVDGSREETLKGYSANLFFSECFFDYARTHNLPLKDGELKPMAMHRKSSVDQYRQKGKLPIDLYHRYVMKRIR